MDMQLPPELGTMEIDLERLQAELQEESPGIKGLSLQTIKGRHAKLIIHGDVGKLKIADVMQRIRKHVPRPRWRDIVTAQDTSLEERVRRIERILAEMGALNRRYEETG